MDFEFSNLYTTILSGHILAIITGLFAVIKRVFKKN